jgi:lambda family phage minor tail protein L
MSKIDARNESLRPGTEVELFMIDLTPIGYPAVQLYFQQADHTGNSVWFGGKEYKPRPIKVSGFKKSSAEAPPEPTLSFSNIDKGGYQLLAQYGDLMRAKVVRLMTYAEFLDKLPDGTPNPTADATATELPEIWFIDQKDSATKQQIVFRLKSIMDLRGKQVPGRDILKSVCRRPYRVWNATTGQFDYPNVAGACPYTGEYSYTRSTVMTTPPYDDCGKDPEGCTVRFPDQSLPGWFFPGARRISRNG